MAVVVEKRPVRKCRLEKSIATSGDGSQSRNLRSRRGQEEDVKEESESPSSSMSSEGSILLDYQGENEEPEGET